MRIRFGAARGALLTLSLVLAAVVGVPTGPSPAGAASPASSDILADFEGAVPAGWFVFNGGGSTVTTTAPTVAAGDALARPGQTGDNGVLQADYNVVDFGGFGQDVVIASGGPQDWSGFSSFDFWFYGTGSGLSYQAEISDNRSNPAVDTSERFDYSFVDDTPGWRYITIPFSDFTRATDFQPGGAPDDGFTLTEIWAWAIVLPQGGDTVYFDDVGLGFRIVDDFESGAAPGTPCVGIPFDFCTFSGDISTVAISTETTPPAPPLPANGGVANSVLQADIDSTSFAGFIHGFTDAGGTWISQDWSRYSGLRFWLYGNNSGSQLFIDLLESRNPGSTSDDAERWTFPFVDDFSGWQLLEIPFADLTRKNIGNGAPNDGLTLQEVHGWAFGALGTGGPRTYYLDDVALYGVAEIPGLAIGFAAPDFPISEGETGTITVELNRPLGVADDDPTSVSVDYVVETIIPEPNRDFVPVAGGTFTFSGTVTEQTFTIQTLEDNKYEPTERLILRLTNPVDVALGMNLQASASIIDDDPFDPLLLDDYEGEPYFWGTTGPVTLDRREIQPGDGDALPGQVYPEGVLEASVPVAVQARVSGNLCPDDRGGDRSNAGGNGVVPFAILTTDFFDATAIDHTTVRLGDAAETHTRGRSTSAVRHEEDVDGDGDIDLVFHVRRTDIGGECDPGSVSIAGQTFDGRAITGGGSDAAFTRDFPIGQNWTGAQGLTFWFNGTGSGDEITIDLLDNRAPDPGPSGWELVWADEFDGAAGAPPDPDNWGYELGDGTVNGIPGWGNTELQYYTASTENAATDGNGDLVITTREADGSLACYYGPCEYSSARLVTTNRAEFAYGRIEARVLVPDGDAGLWPAFWSLGTDIERVTWPQTGEIDFMEYVSRLPNEIFGTIHGPGYSGGNAFGNIYDFGEPVSSDYRTFVTEWQPDLINWYVDGNLYHTAEPDDVPGPWVFNDPVYLLLNTAIGGNFGGTVSPNLVFPQEMKVDYIRVYQAPDTAERFEATFVDSMEGWYEYTIPFDNFVRSGDQPAGAPNDGLTLSEVWGYGFATPAGTRTGAVVLDQVRLDPLPPPTEIAVSSLGNGGEGSLRDAIDRIADGGVITIDPSLAGGTINLVGPLTVSGKTITIDASAAPGVALDGGGSDRVLIVDAGAEARIVGLTLTNGFGFQLAGCVLNNGTLTLDGVTVTGCVMTTDAGDFWQGGAGVYNGGGATFTLVDSTVRDNDSGHAGGGVFSFFGTTTTIERSTISGNTAADVGGGIRSLGDVEVVNSTISGNTATADFHGGAVFVTDGVMNMVNTTVADNTSTGGTSDVFVGTFTDANATLNLVNTIVESGPGSGAACFLAPFGAGAVAINSLGNNVVSDATCSPVTSDQIVPSALLDPLADNGGPTQTHALQAGSPAIDAANVAECPVTDQRGVARDAACDVGSFELAP